MENLWTNINDNMPSHLGGMASRYGVKFVKITALKTAIIGNGFAIVLSIDRYSVDVSYVMRDSNKKLVLYNCGNYLAERYDQKDRINLLNGDDAESSVINNLIVINNGLINKWGNILEGDIKWLEDYNRSKWFDRASLNQAEEDILKEYI